MACNGHNNHCPSHPGYDPPLSPLTWTNDPIGTDDFVETEDYNEMRAGILTELSRRGKSAVCTMPTVVKDVTIIYAEDYRCLRDNLVECKAWSYPAIVSDAVVSAGQPDGIQDETTETLRDRINTLRAECLCNCNYSCTCNCNYCVCNCNHACQCNCNYSDKRLKKDIVYI
jgi:hypothetical protein